MPHSKSAPTLPITTVTNKTSACPCLVCGTLPENQIRIGEEIDSALPRSKHCMSGWPSPTHQAHAGHEPSRHLHEWICDHINSSVRAFHLLSPREQEVVTLLIHGELNKQIASKLGISEKTVEKHRSNAKRKLNVRNTIDLIRTVLLAEMYLSNAG